ncbi:prolipoprotein diacylglyceryl transferase [Prosthecobacter dejongeii]|uniref:Putative membrane protein n=1 Tax=Prosthecobacter dejongeii TaxID=48465 RepID=A0A7W8DNC0_9BACT|nr:hypothetical protein [Prosthecobacter dejongeii]MBB5036167.1 putative membrane protein [Prosthecobacter dejongeii]
MDNPFKPGDKVLIMRKGVELEATVRTTFNHEVQVRVADGELLWRTVKTARLIAASAESPEVPQASQEPSSHEADVSHTQASSEDASATTDTPEAPALAESESGDTSFPAQTAELAEQNSAPAPSSRKDKRRHRHSHNR